MNNNNFDKSRTFLSGTKPRRKDLSYIPLSPKQVAYAPKPLRRRRASGYSGKVRDKLKQVLFSILALSFLFLIALLLSFELSRRQDSTESGINRVWNIKKNYRLLDGELVAEEKTELKPMAVILENHFQSRPISGLEQASIIYEMVVEGDITRFLALFDPELTAKKIGPVRSARPFFVDLVEEWNPVLFHAGGSIDGLKQLKNSFIYNVDEISADGIYFWRDPNRDRPHNLYTSANQMKRAIKAKEIDLKADFSPWLFKDGNESLDPARDRQRTMNQGQIVANVKIDFSGNPLYQVEYQYNPKINDYIRYLAGQLHKTDQGIILKAKNIVVQYVDFEIIDDYGRLEINLNSGGKAEIYQDGQKIIGRWKKVSGRTRFYNQAGEEIKFNRGVIWIELVFNDFINQNQVEAENLE